MQTLAIVARKGGVGKSFICRSLAVVALRYRLPSAIVDCDSQETCIKWAKRRSIKAPAVIPPPIEIALDRLRRAGAKLVLLDCPPFALPLINQAVAAADRSIIVSEPLPESLEQIAPIASIVRALNKPACIVLNKCQPRSNANNLALSALTAFGLPVAPIITQRISHAYASANGQAAEEYETGGMAAIEIRKLWEWLVEREFIKMA